MENVAIFWDYENCPVPSNVSGYAVVDHIRTLAEPYGSVRSLKAYLEVTEQTPSKTLLMRSELQSSGVSLLDCPHNGRKDVADKMIIVDMLAYALDNPAPSTIVLITGDRDFAYAMSVLRLRRYRLVLVTLPHAHVSLTAQATVCLRWNDIVMSVPGDDTPSNALEQVPSTTPALSLESHPLNAVTNPTTHMFNRLHPESDENKRLDAFHTPYSPFAQTFPSHEYIPERSRFLVPVEQPIVRELGGDWKVTHPVHPCSPSSLGGNPTTFNISHSECAIPSTETYARGVDRQLITPNSIATSNSFFGAPRASSSSNPNGDGETPMTNDLNKSVFMVPSVVLGNAISTTKQIPLPITKIGSKPAIPRLVVPIHFKALVQCLQKYRQQGNFRPLRSMVGFEVAKTNVFKKVGVNKFSQYVKIAVNDGIVELGGTDGGAWIFLKPEWVDAE